MILQTKMKLLKLGTFNVRCLTKEFKRHQLNLDLKKYEIDICGLQETKISEKVDKNVGNYRMILLPSESEHYGNGFMIRKEMNQNIYRYWKVSDRICVLQITTNEEYKSHTTELKDSIMKIKLQSSYKATIHENKPKIVLRKTIQITR